jgi:hypothetical protein
LSNARRLPAGAIPAAFSADGQDVPPSTDVAEHNLAQIIGQSVAVHLGELVGPILQQIAGQQRADCFFCLMTAKKLVHDHQVAMAIAAAAGEDMPELPAPPQVGRGITQVVVTQLMNTPAGVVPSSGSVWSCWDHLEVPAEPPKQTGLVAPDGRPIVRT